MRKSGMVIICPALFGRGLRAGASYAVASGSRVGAPFAAPLKKGPSIADLRSRVWPCRWGRT